jgi:Galactose-3-O-sulfotransferase
MKTKLEENLIFLHLPKNGGTTLHGLLERLYPADQTFSILVVDNDKLNIDEFIALSEAERAKIKLLKGHMHFGLHNYLVGPSKYITFLRRPEDRIKSYYHYAKKRPEHRLYNKIMEGDSSFLNFIETMYENDLHNGQIRLISGLTHGTEAEMLEKAIKNIEEHFSFVGLLDHYDESLLLLSKLYGWGLPYYKHRNKGQYGKKQAEEAKILEAIHSRNQGDLALYAYVQERFESLKKTSPNLPFKLQQLSLANKLYNSYKLKAIRKLF